MDNFLRKYDKEYIEDDYILKDFSFGFNHELLKDDDFTIFINVESVNIFICYFENGYFYESILDGHKINFLYDLTVDDFYFRKKKNWNKPNKTQLNDKEISKLKKITESYIKTLKSQKETRYMFLFKEKVSDIIYKLAFGY